MITRITKANADKYRVLFSDAVNALKTHDSSGNLVGSPGAGEPVISSQESYQEVQLNESTFVGGDYYIWNESNQAWELTEVDAVFDPTARYALLIDSSEAISTLEEYFHYIVELQAIHNRYTILPLDEDFFFIDANTRLIEVPKSFRDAGIAVQGDEVAEILYFKINRYFDMDDLATKDILIQWRAPANAEGKRQEGLSKPWVVDIVSEPGYIIFGWPLSSELTANPGKIDFAVRFYTHNEDEDKIVYSLSTLTASAEIKEGLNYDLETILLDGAGIVDASDLIINRLVSSELDGDSAPEAAKPEIIDNFINCYDYEEIVDEEGKIYYNIYLTNPTTGEELNGNYTVQAITNDTGNISYTWIKRDTENEIVQDALAAGTGIRFIEVDDTETDLNKVYYQKQAQDIYTIFNFSDEYPDLKAAADAGIQLYERVSTVIMNASGVHVLGSYQARVTNRLGRKTERAYSNIALVQGPNAPVISKDLNEFVNGVLDVDTNSINLKAEVNVDEHAYTQYLFQKENNGDYETIVTLTTPEYTVIGGAYGSENDGDGLYRVIVESKLNSVIEAVEGKVLRVTHAASPVSISVSDSNLPDGGYNINSAISVTATVNENEKRTADDNIIYQWYKYNGTEEALAKDLENAKQGLYQVQASDTKLEGFNTASIKITNTEANEGGHYFCEITNVYNGTTATKCSSFFNVVDTKKA